MLGIWDIHQHDGNSLYSSLGTFYNVDKDIYLILMYLCNILFCLKISLFYFICMDFSLNVCLYIACLISPQKCVELPWVVVTGCHKMLCVYWKLNLGARQRKSEFATSEPTLQPYPNINFNGKVNPLSSSVCLYVWIKLRNEKMELY